MHDPPGSELPRLPLRIQTTLRLKAPLKEHEQALASTVVFSFSISITEVIKIDSEMGRAAMHEVHALQVMRS
jgi:hypothetical protein